MKIDFSIPIDPPDKGQMWSQAPDEDGSGGVVATLGEICFLVVNSDNTLKKPDPLTRGRLAMKLVPYVVQKDEEAAVLDLSPEEASNFRSCIAATALEMTATTRVYLQDLLNGD